MILLTRQSATTGGSGSILDPSEGVIANTVTNLTRAAGWWENKLASPETVVPAVCSCGARLPPSDDTGKGKQRK
jgi:hypothetical protein